MSCLGGRLCLLHGLLLTGGRSFETRKKIGLDWLLKWILAIAVEGNKKHIYFITNHKRVLNPSLQDGFRDSFGLLMPSLADHFDVGRAEAILTCSIMTFLTLGRYSHLHFHKTSTQKRSQYVWRRNILNLQWASSSCSSLAAWASSHHHGRCLPRLCR